MFNSDLIEIRRWLEGEMTKRYKEVGEESDTDNAALNALKISQEAGEAHQSRKILEILPKPEARDVLDYWALSRVANRKLYDENSLAGDMGVCEDIISNSRFRVRGRALEKVKERLRVKHKDDEDQLVIEDPVSKYKQVTELGEMADEETKETIVNTRIDSFAQEIVDRGVNRP